VKYAGRVAASAQQDADAADASLAERTIHAAAWFNGLEEAIEELAEHPTRWPFARESREFDEPVRQLLYGKSPHVYRVLFIVSGNVVYILHIRHGARRALGHGEIAIPPEGDSPQ
jgi:plasmid stabilization system protein ParE